MNLARCQPLTAGAVLSAAALRTQEFRPQVARLSQSLASHVGKPELRRTSMGSETVDGIKNVALLVPAAALSAGGLAQPVHAENGREVPTEVDL